MTCRPRLFAVSLLLACTALAVSGCEEDKDDLLPPIEAARVALAEGRPMAAEAALQRALGEGASRASLAALMGEAALAQGDLAKAHEWLDAGEFDLASAAFGWRMRGRLAMAEGDLAEASGAFDRALSSGQASAGLWVDIARMRYRSGEQVGAVAAAQAALKLDANAPEALQLMGQLTRDAAGPEAALDHFAKAVKVAPAKGELEEDYAATLGDAGRASEALRQLAGRDSPRSYFLSAVIAARGGEFALSRTLLQRSDEATRETAAARMLGGIADLEEGNSASAAQVFARLLREQPDNPAIRDLHAAALFRSGNHRELVAAYSALALGGRASNYLRILVGRSHEALGDRARAAAFLDGSGEMRTGLVRLAPTGRGGALAQRDAIRGSGGLAAARGFATSNPGAVDALALLGDAELLNGDKGAARKAYAAAASVRQPWPLLQRRLAAARSPEEATGLLEDYVRGHPVSGAASARLSDAFAARGDWQTAAKLLDHALANGMGRVPWVHAARSVAAARLGDGEGALAYAIEAHELWPTSRVATEALLRALPPEEGAARTELAAKLASLPNR